MLDSNLDVLRSITLGKPFLSRQLANFLAVMIDPYINRVNSQIQCQLEEQNLLNKTSICSGNTNQPQYLEKLPEDPNLNNIVESLNQELNFLKEKLTEGI